MYTLKKMMRSFKEEKMKDIVFICDDAYALPTLVSIKSIINNAEINDCYNIHVCTFGLTPKNTELFNSTDTENIKTHIHVIPKNLIEEKIKLVTQRTHVTTVALIKLELANYFSELEQILYLDSDIIVKGSLNELFKTNIKNAYLAASFEYWIHYNNIRYISNYKHNEEFYFNSGVMLLNLKKMRENNIPDKLWDYKLNHAKTKLMDQECLNVICKNAVEPLSIKWNFNPEFLSDEHIKGINEVYHENYKNCGQLLDEAKIIHYVGKKDKPWVYETANLKNFWIENYNSLTGVSELRTKKYVLKKQNILKSSAEKIKIYGISGFLHYVFYRLCKMTRR